jgi:V/A-type H+-transporting ATPase subunit E
MSLNKVVEDILRKGEENKQDVVRLGEKERDEQILQAEKRIEENRLKEEKKTKSLVAQMEQQELSSAELESKKILLAAQRRAMEELKEQVLAELARYPVEKRKKLYSMLAAKAKKDLGECYVYSSKDDKALLQLTGGMVSGGVVDCIGGLIFESKDRSVRLDFRFESLLEEIWNKKLQEIYGKLLR